MIYIMTYNIYNLMCYTSHGAWMHIIIACKTVSSFRDNIPRLESQRSMFTDRYYLLSCVHI